MKLKARIHYEAEIDDVEAMKQIALDYINGWTDKYHFLEDKLPKLVERGDGYELTEHHAESGEWIAVNRYLTEQEGERYLNMIRIYNYLKHKDTLPL